MICVTGCWLKSSFYPPLTFCGFVPHLSNMKIKYSIQPCLEERVWNVSFLVETEQYMSKLRINNYIVKNISLHLILSHLIPTNSRLTAIASPKNQMRILQKRYDLKLNTIYKYIFWKVNKILLKYIYINICKNEYILGFLNICI